MEFIERLFHISPDGGSGVTEVFYLVTISAIVLGMALRQRIARVLSSGAPARTAKESR